jgi:hypothetical protein
MEETFSWDIYEYLMDCDRRVSLSFMAINQSIRTIKGSQGRLENETAHRRATTSIAGKRGYR